MVVHVDEVGEPLRCDTWAEYQDARPNDFDAAMLIPEYDGADPKPYPGGILPGYYTPAGRLAVVTEHFDDARALRFIADLDGIGDGPEG